ncbi:MAG: RNA polymerase sigma-70 factor [Bacteroidota bacterium]
MEKIVSDLSAGSKPAFKKIFRLYSPRLIRYAGFLLKNNDEAEDLVQEVFFQVWENRANLKSEKNLASYLFTLTKNKCFNVLKHKVVAEKYFTSQAAMETEELYHLSFEMQEEFISMEDLLNKELERIMNEMPVRCAEAFRLKWLEGKKIREIAQIMQISTTMVDKHLAKGLKIAREKLSPGMFLLLLVVMMG